MSPAPTESVPGGSRVTARLTRSCIGVQVTGEALIDLDLSGLELAVLSACETGLGDVAGGEGVYGLQRAFHYAGTRNVVASLWKVPDAETETLMTQFCRGWLKGEDKADALREAQLKLIRELRTGKDAARRRAPPLYWAGFICHGQPK